jgi:hypothetical protein
MTYSVPVIEPARGETRKATSSATSFGFAGRPNGDAAERRDRMRRGNFDDMLAQSSVGAD